MKPVEDPFESGLKRLATKVVIVCAHPRTPSLCESLAVAYAEGARSAGATVELLKLAELEFDPDVRTISPRQQALEPDLLRAWQLIEAADHLVFVYPAWWGVGPARLKGFLDRILLPSVAFREREDGGFEGLMRSKTAHLLTTIDMPAWVYHLIYRAPGHHAMSRSTLGFCGVETTRILSFGPVRTSSAENRARWIERARRLGFSLRKGPSSRPARIVTKSLAWLRALRLQFYPMPWMAYTVGALGALSLGATFDAGIYAFGYATLLFLEAGTVFTNDRFDYDSDRRNLNHGPFTGGSRVLVDGSLTLRELAAGTLIALMAAFTCTGVVLQHVPDLGSASFIVAALFVLGLGYTAPPMKLSWRSLGETTVALTHSICVVLWGFVLQGGSVWHPFPWLISVPLFLGILPAITLSAIPDMEADREAGKRTLAVRLGATRAKQLALAATAATALVSIPLARSDVLESAFANLLPFVLPHALLLMVLIGRDIGRHKGSGRIDGLMVAALTYIIWFALVPLIHLW